jgi:hypothetical protein
VTIDRSALPKGAIRTAFLPKHDDLQFFELARTRPQNDEPQNALNLDVADRKEHDASGEMSKSAVILVKPN